MVKVAISSSALKNQRAKGSVTEPRKSRESVDLARFNVLGGELCRENLNREIEGIKSSFPNNLMVIVTPPT